MQAPSFVPGATRGTSLPVRNHWVHAWSVSVIDEREYRRWYEHAERTLASAERDRSAGDHNWACFKAEQAAQFALKGLLRALGKEAFGHSLLRLLDTLEDCSVAVPEEVRAAARALEADYIPSRYPDVYPSGAPGDFFDAARAGAALENARRVLSFTSRCYEHARSSQT